jgi:hypothetical protein
LALLARSFFALSAALAAAACGDASAPGPPIGIRFQTEALLADASELAIYIYDGTADDGTSTTCLEVRPMFPRPTSLLGPYKIDLDPTQRGAGVTFTRQDIPVGVYVVLADAYAGDGTLVGTGCAEGQHVYDRQISQIQIVITRP